MKHLIFAALFAGSLLAGSENVLFSFPGDKFGKGPGLILKNDTLTFAPVSRMYVDKKFDPAGGRLFIQARFAPAAPENKDEKIQHYFWSARGNNRTVASGIFLEQNGAFMVHFYVFDTNKKAVSCAANIKLPADKSITLDYIWTTSAISIKVNGLLVAKKNYSGTLQAGAQIMVGTALKNRPLIPMTLEKLQLYAPVEQ